MCKSTGRELTPEQKQMLAEFEEADDQLLDQSGVLNVDFGGTPAAEPAAEETESTWLEHLSEEDECATEGDQVDQALCQAWAADSSSDGPGAAEAATAAPPAAPAPVPAPPAAPVSPPPALSSPPVDPSAVQLARMLERDRAAAVQLLEKRTGGAQLTHAETSELRGALASLIYELTS